LLRKPRHQASGFSGNRFGPAGDIYDLHGPRAAWVDSSVIEDSQVEFAEAHQGVKDVGGSELLASVKDADSNVIGLLQSA
jgi:hypothetical protein